ncbi:MAG: Crp/Fnr family transcriptional regulator [Gammaproteobacteria bacterium]|nr:Crp/Fnr family transcriptional regulator [Gammaproteobacteria bacterium]
MSKVGKAMLGPGLHYTRFDKKTAVLGKGQAVSGAYVVISGRLRVFTLSPDGNEATLYWIAPGETCVLALNCIFNDLLYPAWVEAEAATTIAVIPGPLYRMLFENEAVIRNVTVQALSTLVFRLMDELERIHSSKLEQRLANFLLLRAAADGSVRMTQQEIAAHLGTSREVIARLFRQFVAKKYVSTQRGAVLINQPARLMSLVKKDFS